MAKQERLLREQVELLRVTLSSIGDGVIATDVDGRITSLNPAAETLTGWTSGEAVGEPLEGVFRIADEATGKTAANPVARALQEGVVVGLGNHTMLVAKDGQARSIADSAAPIKNDEGEVVGCVLIFRDISEQRRLEREIAQRLSESRLLASIVESSNDAIVSKTLEGIIQSWNAGAQALFGYTAAEMLGRPITTIIPPDRVQEEELILGRIRAGDRVDHFETVRMRHDGTPVHVSLTISPIRDEDGRIVGASKIARDITDRKQAEERIYGLLAELKEADRMKDEFLAVLGHELRNPMAPLSNMLEIMKRSSGNEMSVAQARSTMERQLSQLVRLVDDLVDVSRITRGTMELRRERIELASVLHHAVETCRPLADRAHLDLDVEVPREPIYLNADPVRLAQVFSNILSNACKFSRPGGHVHVGVDRQGSEVAVHFRDEGIGIPPEKLDSVFDMFSQLDRSLERTQGGLGIGLTLVKRLVTLLDGTVTAESAGEGQGSEITVRLPVLAERRSVQRHKPPTEPSRAPHRILIVDDNEDAASSLAILLKISGHATNVAYDGFDALDAARNWHPDVILLDIGLPKLNGYEVCRRIRQEPWGVGVVIVAMTGWGQDEDRRRSKEAGFDHHMVKPMNYDALMELLSKSAA